MLYLGRSRFINLSVLLIILIVGSGCASSRTAGIEAAVKDIEAIERISNNRRLYNLQEFEGVALLSLGKAGAFGIGVMGATASIYLKNPETDEFGAPSFVGYGGPSIGLLYGFIGAFDCLLLFKNREDVDKFSKKHGAFNFTNEASFMIWGRRQMTIPGALSYSDGAGLSVGAIEFEFLAGGPNDSLHGNMYGVDTTVDKILIGDVQIPEELKEALERLNVLMKR